MTEEKIIEELKKLSQLMERMGDLHKATILYNALELIDNLKSEHNNLTPPCKIGDTVWAIQNLFGTRRVTSGKVSEMFYLGKDMILCIVIRNVVRGTWGKNVFPTREAALEALEALEKGD